MNYSESDLQSLLSRSSCKIAGEKRVEAAPKVSKAPASFALGRLKTGERNKTEAAYESYLESLKAAGDVLWYRFEGIKLRLADNTFYTPDFAVMASDGVMECHEVKGHWQDDARVKVKVAAEMYPFRFRAIKKVKGGWGTEHF